MSTSKRLTYRQITAAAEQEIREIMTMATGDHLDHVFRQWAKGVWRGWNSLTLGWQDDGDGARLKSLFEDDGPAG